MANNYPFKRSGYIYSKGTAAGFQRMQRLGIPRPLFRLEDRLARILKAQYKRVIRDLLQDLKRVTTEANVTLDQAPLTQDSLDDLLDFFDEMSKEMEKQQDQQKKIASRADMAAALNTLEHTWIDADGNPTEDDEANAEAIRQDIDQAFKQEQGDYLVRLFNDADGKTQGILQSFSIDKQQIFNENMEALRALYIDNSMERIAGEEDYIKRAILKRIMRYVNGQDEKLSLDDLTKYAYAKGDNLARLFARDQMQRFNKAVTLSTFINANVTKIKWVTSHDVRVRDTHKALDGKIFNINELPPEIDDYNCRCGLVPVEWSE